jgi:hypothetical protein
MEEQVILLKKGFERLSMGELCSLPATRLASRIWTRRYAELSINIYNNHPIGTVSLIGCCKSKVTDFVLDQEIY